MLPTPASRPRVVVLGSINMDLVAEVPHIPAAGETLTGHSLSYIPGGKGANQAVAAARLGAEVRMCGRLGDDAFSSTLRQGLIDNGIDVTHVLDTAGASSGVAWIHVDTAGRNSITVIPGSNGQVTPADVRGWEAVIQAADVLLLQLEIPCDAVAEAIGLARHHHVPVVLDLAPIPPHPLPESLWTADVLSPNQIEAAQLVGFPVTDLASAERAAAVLLTRGPRSVVIKLGELGALLATRDHPPVHIPAVPVTPVDTTAAGDAFTAAFAVAWAEGHAWQVATEFACRAGAAATLTRGAQPSMPTRDQLQQMWPSPR